MKTRNCRRVSGLSPLEVTCRQHSDGMRPIVLNRRRAIDKCRSATLQWFWRLSQMVMQRCSIMQHIFAYNGLPWGLTPRDLHI